MDITEIRWDNKALEQTRTAILYCQQMYGQRVALKFRKLIIENSNLLINNPFIGKVEEVLSNSNKIYRSMLVGHLYKLIYTVNEEQGFVYIQLFWNCYQDPVKLRNII